MTSFANLIWAVPVGERVVALDAGADRYFQLGPAVASALRNTFHGTNSPRDFALLHYAGLASSAPNLRPLAPPSIRIAEHHVVDAPLQSIGRALVAEGVIELASARLRLRHLGLAAALQWSMRRSAVYRIENEGVVAVAQAFEHARGWFPARRRCLPDSMALFSMLARRKLAASLVIGVSMSPFRAHCWVQTAHWLLTDRYDEVADLTPLLAIP